MDTEPKTTKLTVQEPRETQGNIPAVSEPSVFGLFPTKTQIAEYEEFLNNYNGFIDSQLKENTDFGIIPGVEKPSLLKPGAEKLEKLLFLTHKKECISKTVTPEFISYTYKTRVYDRNGNVKSTCEGTCNSKEKKYRYITVFENQATEEQKKNGRLENRFSKAKGKSYNVYVLEKEDYYDLENTIMKMAQKRSYVGAILEATNSSGRFTQDVEDMDLPVPPVKPIAPKTSPDEPFPTPINYVAQITGAKTVLELMEIGNAIKADTNLSAHRKTMLRGSYESKLETLK